MEILLIDDDVGLGEMLKEYLESEGFRVSVALTGERGVEAALSGRFAAVILDVMLPRMSGLDVLRTLRRSSAYLPVIMLTAKGDNVERVLGLEMGADDYLPKPCYPRELLARLRAVLRRSRSQDAPPPDELVLGLLSLHSAQHRVSWGGQNVELTASEFQLLELLLRAAGRVLSKDELCEQVLRRKREAYDRSIDVHVSNLRLKLQAAGATAVQIETVRGIGYRLELSA